MENSLKHIYFTKDFKKDIASSYNSLVISSFRLGEYSGEVPRGEVLSDGRHSGIEYISYDYMRSSITLPNGMTSSDSVSPSPSTPAYSLDGVYDKSSSLLNIYVLPKTTKGELDEGLFDTDKYKLIYILYKNILTDIEKLAFVIYNEDIETNYPNMVFDPLNLSKYNNLISIKLPVRCELITYMDRDTTHLESPGVNYMNYYSINDNKNTYVGMNSYIRHYMNSISSDIPNKGCITINKFGLKLY